MDLEPTLIMDESLPISKNKQGKKDTDKFQLMLKRKKSIKRISVTFASKVTTSKKNVRKQRNDLKRKIYLYICKF